jgi:hypothetical protein
MEYKKLGRTGLDVSRICLGCMSYGGGNQGNHAWSLARGRGKGQLLLRRGHSETAEEDSGNRDLRFDERRWETG